MDFTWVTTDDANAIQNSIVDAKGDLISATANDTPARLAVGANGETLVADSSTSTGLRYQAPYAQQPVLNSAFQVWQRGTSVAVSGAVYTADRWQGFRSGGVAGSTISRQTTSDTTNLPNIQYCARVQRDSGNTSTAYVTITQPFETINTIPYVGKTITLSYYARRGANFSATSNALLASVYTGTGNDQTWISGYTGFAVASQTTATLTTTWQRFTATVTLATTVTEMSLGFSWDPTGTAGAADYFEITGVQLELGSVATPFHTYAATIQGELAACQRYYFRYSAASYEYFATGVNRTSVLNDSTVRFPVTMRVAPSNSNSAANTFMVYQPNPGTIVTATNINPDGTTTNSFGLNITVASGLTAGNAANVRANNTSAFLEFSAEL
jgi:hypothetical protein